MPTPRRRVERFGALPLNFERSFIVGAWAVFASCNQSSNPTLFQGCTSDADCTPVGQICDPVQSPCPPTGSSAGAGGGATGGSAGAAPGGSGGTTDVLGGSGGTIDVLDAGGAGGPAIAGSGGSGGSSPEPDIEDMIDDLEDGDDRILEASGRQGPWHIFNDWNGGGNQTPTLGSPFAPEEGGANDSRFAVHTTGEGYAFAGVGFDLNNPEMTPESRESQAYDASQADGLLFRAKGSARLRVEFATRGFVPRDHGGSCDSNCWNVYGEHLTVPLDDEWREYRVTFSALERESGDRDPAFDASQLMSIAFKHEGDEQFDFWIDDVRFFWSPSAGGTATGTGSSGAAGSAP